MIQYDHLKMSKIFTFHAHNISTKSCVCLGHFENWIWKSVLDISEPVLLKRGNLGGNLQLSKSVSGYYKTKKKKKKKCGMDH